MESVCSRSGGPDAAGITATTGETELGLRMPYVRIYVCMYV